MFKKNYWPHAIILMILGSIIASYSTIKIAVENPVQDSNLFLNNYHITDKNINDILRSQILFNSKYSFDYSKSKFSKDGFELDLEILQNGERVNSLISSTVTRPETGDFDKSFSGERFSFQFPKSGRWIIYVKATVNNLTGYFSLELDSRESDNVQLLDPFISHKRVEKIRVAEEEKVKELLKN